MSYPYHDEPPDDEKGFPDPRDPDTFWAYRDVHGAACEADPCENDAVIELYTADEDGSASRCLCEEHLVKMRGY